MRMALTLTLLLLLPNVQAAAEAITPKEGEQKDQQQDSIIDDTHKSVSNTILLFTNRIDAFFGTRRGDEEANGSKLRVFFDHNVREFEKDRSRVDLRFTLKLPQLEKLFKFEFNKDPKKEKVIKAAQAESEEQKSEGEKQESIMNIPYKLFQKWSYGISTGIRVRVPPDPYIRARLRRTYLFGGFEFNPTQELSWFLKDGLGYSMSNDLDFQISEWGLFRLTNSLNWTDSSDEVFTTHGPNFFLPLNDKTAIQFYALASGRNRPTFYIHQYSVGASYRRSIYSNWAFFSINPSLTWPETRQWQRVLGLNLRLEAVFGSL